MTRRPGRRRPSPTGLALGAYGSSMVALGVAVVLGPTAGGDPAPGSTAGRTTERPPALAEAPLVTPRVPGASGGSRPPSAEASGVPKAPLAEPGRTAPGQTRPFRPAGIVLPSGSTARIKPVGVHPDGAMVIPEDPAEIGWWNGGALAGDAFGSIVVAGHVDSRRFGLGVLAELKTVRQGDVITLRSGDRSLRYRVTASQRVRQARLAGDTDVFRQDVAPRLVLITCGGVFDPVRHRYSDNLVIVAEPVPAT